MLGLEKWLTGAGLVMVCASGVAWAGCSSDDPATQPSDSDAGNPSSGDSGTSGSDAGNGGVDSGNSGQDSGPPAANVTIKYGSCPAFTACGGDVTGKWTLTGGCLSEEAFSAAKQPPCEGVTESDVVIKAGGTVEATATNVLRKTSITLTAKLAIPQACASQVPAGGCPAFGTLLTSAFLPGGPFFDTATCTDAVGGGCTCNVGRVVNEDTNDAYTITGNTLTTTNPTRTFDYCVAGNKNTYKETTTGGLPIIVEITK